MLVEITKTVRTRETVEITLPHFYKHDLGAEGYDSVIYGKISEKEHRQIQITYRRNETTVEVERSGVNWNQIGCYLSDEFKSNADEYARAKSVALKEIESA